jgi:hypothetical protein
MIFAPQQKELQYFSTTESMDSAEMQVEPTKNEPIEKESKKVRFSESVYVRKTLHLNDFTDKELDNSWYTSQESAQMKREQKKTLELLKSGDYQGDSEQHCARGLECRLNKRALARHRNKMSGWLVVLEEQAMQNLAGISDPKAIASAYAAVSKHCKIAAYNMAVMDQLFALNIDRTEDDVKERSLQTYNMAVMGRLHASKLDAEEGSRKKRVAPRYRLLGKRNQQ